MRLEAISKRISLARESRTRNILPYDDFLDKISSAAKLVDFVEKNGADRKVRLEARKHFVVACVGAMETYFKAMAHVFVDMEWMNHNFLGVLKQDKISLADLFEVNKKKLSLGEIIAVSYSFQDLESINRVYSRMLGVTDFLQEVASVTTQRWAEKAEKQFQLKKDYPDFLKRIGELISLRHLIVHHAGFKGTLGLQRLGEMWENLDAFVAAAEHYLLNRMPLRDE